MHKQDFDPEEEGWHGGQTYTFTAGRNEEGEDKLAYARPVHTADKYLYGVTPINYRDRVAGHGSFDARSEGPYQAIKRSMGRATSKMKETLARSTVPASDLEGLTHIDLKGKEPGKEQWGGYYQSQIGRGQKATQRAARVDEMIPGVTPREQKAGHIVLSPDPDEFHEPGHSEMTLLHELGHHASWMRGRPHAMYNSPHYRAAEEASADTYSLRHFRQRADRTGRQKVKETWPEGAQRSVDPRTHSYGARGNYGPDQMPEHGDWSVHMPEYKLEPHMELPQHLRGGYNERHYPSHQEEAHARPMLDEGGSEVFKPEHMGITRPLTPERALKNEPPDRQDIYKRNAYSAGDLLNQQHVEAARQWEVPRNVHPANISRQFGG